MIYIRRIAEAIHPEHLGPKTPRSRTKEFTKDRLYVSERVVFIR